MAWAFDDANTDDVQITDNAALTFPDADWALSGWFQNDDNTGSLFQFMFSWGGVPTAPSFHIFLNEASAANANKLVFIQNGNHDVTNTILSAVTPGSDTDWHHLILQRSSGTTSMYIDGSVEADTIGDVGDTNAAANLFFGCRSDSAADRYFDGSLAEWAKWDRALSTGEIVALAAGFTPDFLPKDLKWHVHMFGGRYAEERAGLIVTNNGSTAVDHPGGLAYPSAAVWVPPGAAPAESSSSSSLGTSSSSCSCSSLGTSSSCSSLGTSSSSCSCSSLGTSSSSCSCSSFGTSSSSCSCSSLGTSSSSCSCSSLGTSSSSCSCSSLGTSSSSSSCSCISTSSSSPGVPESSSSTSQSSSSSSSSTSPVVNVFPVGKSLSIVGPAGSTMTLMTS